VVKLTRKLNPAAQNAGALVIKFIVVGRVEALLSHPSDTKSLWREVGVVEVTDQ